MNSLRQIESSLQRRVNNPALFSLLNTRLILRTGIDLKAISASDDRNPDRVAKVLEALTALGYPPSSLTPS